MLLFARGTRVVFVAKLLNRYRAAVRRCLFPQVGLHLFFIGTGQTGPRCAATLKAVRSRARQDLAALTIPELKEQLRASDERCAVAESALESERTQSKARTHAIVQSTVATLKTVAEKNSQEQLAKTRVKDQKINDVLRSMQTKLAAAQSAAAAAEARCADAEARRSAATGRCGGPGAAMASRARSRWHCGHSGQHPIAIGEAL